MDLGIDQGNLRDALMAGDDDVSGKLKASCTSRLRPAYPQFESLTARLNIEKRIQFGAEKFLEVGLRLRLRISRARLIA